MHGDCSPCIIVLVEIYTGLEQTKLLCLLTAPEQYLGASHNPAHGNRNLSGVCEQEFGEGHKAFRSEQTGGGQLLREVKSNSCSGVYLKS